MTMDDVVSLISEGATDHLSRTPESVVRAARYGYGLMLAIIGGPADRFRPFADLYRRSLPTFGHDSRQ